MKTAEIDLSGLNQKDSKDKLMKGLGKYFKKYNIDAKMEGKIVKIKLTKREK